MKKYLNELSALAVITVLSFGLRAQSGQDMFDETYVHEIEITFDDPNFWDSLTTYYDNMMMSGADKKYMMASGVTIDGNVIDSVGVRQKGFFSNWGAFGSDKKPLKLDFKEFKDQKYDGLKKINLANGFKDPSMLRDVMAYRVFRTMGLRAPRTSYAKVYINNQYWGLYIVVEQIDSEFIEDNFPADSTGNLYKCTDNTSLTYQGNNWSSYSDEFELRTNTESTDHARFIDLVKKIATTPSSQFKDSLDEMLETSDYLAILACDILMYNWDSYYDHGRNFYMYLDPLDNKFNWIPWDYNLAFSDTDTDVIVDYSQLSSTQHLVEKMQADSDYRSLYFQHMCYILLSKFNLTELEAYIDAYATLIRPALDADPNKFFTIANFDTNVTSDVLIPGSFFEPDANYPGIKSFISGRMNTVLGQLSNHGFSCTLNVEEEQALSEVNAYPNPIEDLLIIDMGTKQTDAECSIFSLAGQKVHEFGLTSGKNEVDFSAYDSGVYLITIIKGDGRITKKVVKK